MPSCQQAVFRLLILKGITFFPPNFHLKWSSQKNLPKMTIWYIKASLILLMEYTISVKILLNMVWHIFNYFTHYSLCECQMFLTTVRWWKKRGISGVLHHSHSGSQVEAANKQSLSHAACRISISFSKHQYLTWTMLDCWFRRKWEFAVRLCEGNAPSKRGEWNKINLYLRFLYKPN